MSGTINPLLWSIADRDTVVGETAPRYGGGGPRDIPTDISRYQGIIPTPPDDYGPTVMNLPHDYYNMQQLLRPGDPKAWNQLLRMLYWNRDNTRT